MQLSHLTPLAHTTLSTLQDQSADLKNSFSHDLKIYSLILEALDSVSLGQWPVHKIDKTPTALHQLSKSSLEPEIAVPLFELFHSAGVNMNEVNAHQETPLHGACKHGTLSHVQTLLRLGASPFSKDQAGQTPLHWALCSTQLDAPLIALALLQVGAHPDQADHQGLTARQQLHQLIEGQPEREQLALLEAEALKAMTQKMQSDSSDLAALDDNEQQLLEHSSILASLSLDKLGATGLSALSHASPLETLQALDLSCIAQNTLSWRDLMAPMKSVALGLMHTPLNLLPLPIKSSYTAATLPKHPVGDLDHSNLMGGEAFMAVSDISMEVLETLKPRRSLEETALSSQGQQPADHTHSTPDHLPQSKTREALNAQSQARLVTMDESDDSESSEELKQEELKQEELKPLDAPERGTLMHVSFLQTEELEHHRLHQSSSDLEHAALVDSRDSGGQKKPQEIQNDGGDQKARDDHDDRALGQESSSSFFDPLENHHTISSESPSHQPGFQKNSLTSDPVKSGKPGKLSSLSPLKLLGRSSSSNASPGPSLAQPTKTCKGC